MTELIKALEEIIEKKAEDHDIRKELSALTKMLKTGFDSNTSGMEKVPKLFASNDEKKIAKTYDTIGNLIVAMKITGNLDKFSQYLNIHFGINISFASDSSPNLKFNSNKKKFKKFEDLYTGYFLDSVPQTPVETVGKILKSIDALTKEHNNINDEVKDSLKEVINGQAEHSPLTVKTVDKIMTSARFKAIPPEDVANNIEELINLQQQGVDIILKKSEEET